MVLKVLAIMAVLTGTQAPSAPREAEPEMTFRHFGVSDGLSQSSVISIAQDRLGNIWMGTMNGLNVYDGYGFHTYYASPGDINALQDNRITALAMDSGECMWIGTQSGLSCYEFSTARFMNYPELGRKHIFNMVENEGQLILSTDDGLWYLSLSDHSFRKEAAVQSKLVRSASYSEGTLLIATDNGLINLENGVAKAIDAFRGMDIYCAVQSSGTGWWIGTYGQGLYRTDANFNIIRHFGKQDGSLPSDYIRAMRADGYGRLCVGTYDGLAVYDDLHGHFSIYRHDRESTSLSHDSIRSIFVDTQKGVWLGTWFGGVNYWNRQEDKLRTVQITVRDVYGFVSCLAPDPSSNLIWVGTNDDGLWQYNPDNGRFTRPGINISSGNIKCIVPGKDGLLYVGTHLDGMFRLDPVTGKDSHYTVNDRLPMYNGCYSLMEDDGGNWWVGTLDGLMELERDSRSLRPHKVTAAEPELLHAQITCLVKDSKSRVWIGSGCGLFMVPSPDGKVLTIRDIAPGLALDDINVSHIRQDRSGNIWIASDQGLLQYSDDGAARLYTVNDGLPNNYILSVLDDDSGMIWMTTGESICRLNPDNGTIFRVSRHSGNEFSNGACCQDSRGDFNFGGLGGITRFRPSDMFTNPFSPQPFFQDVEITGNASCTIRRDGSGNVVSARFPSMTRSVTIRYTVVNPLSHSDNSFSYMLEGFDRTWYTTQSRQMSYSNLSPGKYRLHLKSANSEDRWCRDESVLNITVLPSWWQTALAKTIWVLFILGVIAAMGFLIVNRTRMKKSLEKERMERMAAEDNVRHTKELLIKQLSSQEREEIITADDEFIRQAVNVVKENMDNEAFNSSDFARKMFMSRSNLYLRLTSITGESATGFIRRIRLERACQLLKENKKPVSEISAMVGFSSPSYFATSFKKYMGCLPSEYSRK